MAERLDIELIKSQIESPGYEVDYATPNGDGALFLPSISSLYAKHVSKDDSTIRNGDCPAGMKTILDLDFLDPEKGIYWYPWALYSAGHAQLDLTKTDIQERMIQKRDRNRTFILADSGGYQLSTGVLKGNMGNLDSMAEDPASMRHKIMKWCEYTADFSMILDIPTTSCQNPKSFIYKEYGPDRGYTDKDRFYKCLEYTVKNCAYYMKHRTPGATKMLNVLQGRDIRSDGTGENDIWYGVVKYFNNPEQSLKQVKQAYNDAVTKYGSDKIGLFEIVEGDEEPFGDRAFEGWAIPGNLKFDFPMLIQRFRIMTEEGYFENTGENLLIHFLGISRVSAGLLYTTLQNEMRKHINPNIIITYDAASPFVCTAKGKGYGPFTVNTKKMAYSMNTLPDRRYEERTLALEAAEKEKEKIQATTIDNTSVWDLFESESTKIDPMNIPIRFSRSSDAWHDHHIASATVMDATGNEVTVEHPTTLGSKLTVGDICYKTWEDESKSFWDGTSYVYIMNMNVEQHIRAIQLAYQFYRLPDSQMRNYLPEFIVNGKIMMQDVIANRFDIDKTPWKLKDFDKILGMSPQEPETELDILEHDDERVD